MFSGYGIFCSANIYLTLFCSMVISNCSSSFLTPFSVPYSLGKPDEVFELKKKLNEVSGLNVTGSDQVALIDDEKGSIFYYDLIAGNVLHDISFSESADFEDLVIHGDTSYALKSDGTITEIISNGDTVVSVKTYDTPLDEFNDTEGLCYDAKRNALLIACKGKPTFIENDKRYRGRKAIYRFDLSTMKLNETPLFLIDVHKVEGIILGMQKNIIRRIMSLYNLSTKAVFQPSGIAIHPQTGEIYVISAVGNVLLILTEEGKILHAMKLSNKLYIQPEGITFDSTGILFIANEGKTGKGNILKFEYKKQG